MKSCDCEFDEKNCRRELTRALVVAPAVQVARILDTRLAIIPGMKMNLLHPSQNPLKTCKIQNNLKLGTRQVGWGGTMESGGGERGRQLGSCLSLLSHSGAVLSVSFCRFLSFSFAHSRSPSGSCAPYRPSESSLLPAGAPDTRCQETCESAIKIHHPYISKIVTGLYLRLD